MMVKEVEFLLIVKNNYFYIIEENFIFLFKNVLVSLNLLK